MTSGKARPVIWNGVEFPSMADAARAKGVTRERMRQLIAKGRVSDGDKRIRVRYSSLCKPCAWDGVEYPSITAAAQANGVSVQVMRWRLLQGYTGNGDMKRRLRVYHTDKRREHPHLASTVAIHINTGSNRYINTDSEKCWHCSDVPDYLGYTYFGAPLCKQCWDGWWLATEDGQTDPPFDQIRNSFWIGGKK